MQDPQMQQMMFQQMGNMAATGGLGASPMGAFGPALLGMGGFPPPAGTMPAAPTAPPVSPTAAPAAPAAPAQPAPTPPAPLASDFNAMLTNVLTNMNTPPPAGAPANAGATVAPEIRYASQISQLCDMGFFDADANLRALVATGGNVNAAVERLLSGV